MAQDTKHPRSKSVGYALTLTARLHRARSATHLTDIDLYPGQDQALQVLARGPMTMGELAASLQVKPPTASKTIGRLSQQGLVVRQSFDGDARLVQVALTPEGENRALALEGLADTVEDEMMRGFDGRDRKRLRKLLRKAAKNLAKAGGLDVTAIEAEEESDRAEDD